MKAIMVMYDSLRRDMLPVYNPSTPLDMPNFKRLADHSVTFDQSYVCSMPCMPARREIHTGRANFLHRSWGPIEPFDNSMPEILRKNGVHSHLATDHYHYVQDGGATYCGRYSTWDCFRGQESDEWQGDCVQDKSELPPQVLMNEATPSFFTEMRKRGGWQNMANRSVISSKEQYPQAQTFANGLKFMEKNAEADNWFLQIETFDPHEPFSSPEEFHGKWFDPDDTFALDWPPYAKVAEDEETIQKMRKKYFALAEFCDACLGQVLDKMDELDLWKDTMLIVNTDHGFFLGEHDWWGKGTMPDYEELTHTPMFIWDPRAGVKGVKRQSVVQTIDLAPTVLGYFGLPIPAEMTGKDLEKLISADEAVREYAIFGYFGGPINITDGRYVFMRNIARPEQVLYEHTLMPTHMRTLFTPQELKHSTLVPALSFTKECPVLRIPSEGLNRMSQKIEADMLFDLADDPEQKQVLSDQAKEAAMLHALKNIVRENDAPEEIYTRYAL